MRAANAPKFALDTSVLIPMVAAWHENRTVAVRAVEKLLRAGWTPVIPATVLREAFAVLTRLPAPLRVKPAIARAALSSAHFVRPEPPKGPKGEEPRKDGQMRLF